MTNLITYQLGDNCPRCGEILREHKDFEVETLYCLDCGFTHYILPSDAGIPTEIPQQGVPREQAFYIHLMRIPTEKRLLFECICPHLIKIRRCGKGMRRDFDFEATIELPINREYYVCPEGHQIVFLANMEGDMKFWQYVR